ncbi:MAG: rhodanese-like domain-containing protein [Bdellovibrionales bacterium]|nr:rhodanese-like domain-containing protein [Bdellovibrionales bacterium]
MVNASLLLFLSEKKGISRNRHAFVEKKGISCNRHAFEWFLMKKFLSTVKSYLRSNTDIIAPELAWEAIDDGAFVLDCRSERESASGTVPGALVIPHTEIAARLSEIPQAKDTVIVAYCAVGGRSGMVKDYLQSLGYQHVLNGGGYDDLASFRENLSSLKE